MLSHCWLPLKGDKRKREGTRVSHIIIIYGEGKEMVVEWQMSTWKITSAEELWENWQKLKVTRVGTGIGNREMVGRKMMINSENWGSWMGRLNHDFWSTYSNPKPKPRYLTSLSKFNVPFIHLPHVSNFDWIFIGGDVVCETKLTSVELGSLQLDKNMGKRRSWWVF